MNGLWRSSYPGCANGSATSSTAPVLGCTQVCLPWSAMNALQTWPADVTWSPIVSAVSGYTHPVPGTNPCASAAAWAWKSVYLVQPPRVSALGTCPLTAANSSTSSLEP